MVSKLPRSIAGSVTGGAAVSAVVGAGSESFGAAAVVERAADVEVASSPIVSAAAAAVVDGVDDVDSPLLFEQAPARSAATATAPIHIGRRREVRGRMSRSPR